MIDRFSKFRAISATVFCSFALSACSTISSVTDAINPFDSNDEVSQGDIPTDPERISILSLDDKLEIAGTILPSEIVLPAVYTNPDWPQTGGYPTHAPQRTNVPGNLNKVLLLLAALFIRSTVAIK